MRYLCFITEVGNGRGNCSESEAEICKMGRKLFRIRGRYLRDGVLGGKRVLLRKKKKKGIGTKEQGERIRVLAKKN
jgi:hypothetical protein